MKKMAILIIASLSMTQLSCGDELFGKYHPAECQEVIFTPGMKFLTANSPCSSTVTPTPYTQTSNPSAGDDRANVVVLDSSSLYVGGYDSSLGNTQWRIEKRNLTDGELVTAFGTAGVVTSNPSGSAVTEEVLGMALDSSSMYVVGRDATPGNRQLRIEKRSLTDGSLVAAFGTAGVVTENPSGGTDQSLTLAIDSSSLYMAGFDESSGDREWQIEKRSLTDGSLDTSFGTGGIVTSNPTAGTDQASGIAQDSTSIYTVGFDSSGGNQWRIDMRLK